MTGGLPRTRDTGRPARLAALACAVSTLLAALLLCVSPASAHGAPAGPSGTATAGSANVRTGPFGHAGPLGLPTVERPVQGPALDHAAAPVHVCSALDPDRGRGGRSGCSGSSEPGADATLPGPPPQPGLAALPYLPLLPAAPASGARGPLPGSDLAPDLHVLQVQRT